MARDFIKIDTNNAVATQAALIMNHNNDSTVFTDIETLFGLPSGKGQIVFDMVNGSIGSMEGTFQTADAKNITERLG